MSLTATQKRTLDLLIKSSATKGRKTFCKRKSKKLNKGGGKR